MRDARDQKSYGSIASDSDNGSHVDHPSSTIPRIAVTPAPVRRQSSIQIYLSFIDEFRKCTGGWQILVIGMLLSLGIGSVIGIIPQVTTQRYAEQLFGYDGPPCASFLEHKPAACIIGASSAQTSASYCSMAKNTLSLLCNPMAGSFSDRHGRRGILIFALFVIMSSPAALFLIQVYPAIHPGWYFVVDSFTGTLSFFSIAYSMLSDSMPPRHRAASFGMFFGAFFSGIAIGPLLAVILDHIQVAFVSFLVRVVALVFCVVALPETLRPEIAAGNIEKQRVAPIQAVCTVLRPLYEMSILCRNKTLVLLTIGTFLSKLVFSADVTLFFYYVENNLGVRDHDVAGMLFLTGCVGMLVQAVFLKYLISLLSEGGLLITSFISGIGHNLIYGLAPNKAVVYVGLCLAQLTSTNGPLLSSLASRNVDEGEQGRIQGALFALSALAEAIGPLCMNFVYRNWNFFGPGTMFVVAAILYGFGTVAIVCIPSRATRIVDEETDQFLRT